MSKIQRFALLFLILFFTFFAGVFFMKKSIPPIPQLNEAYTYLLKRNPSDNTTPRERILNDMGRYPYRLLRPADPTILEAQAFWDLGLAESHWRQRDARVYVDKDRREAKLTLISGLFGSNEIAHGVVLIDQDGSLLHQWPISQNFAEWANVPDFSMLVHGFEVFPDGSIIAALNKGNTLARIDACGEPIWAKEFGIHHSIAQDGPDHIWTWDGENDMVRVKIADGEVVDRVTLDEVMKANPDIDILGVLQVDQYDQSTWLSDPFHANDVEALPAELADAFPGFEAGDLLVSLRSLNLIMVIDSETARVRWWRQGVVRRQHDPDWQPDGTILVFDNNTNRGYSRIRSIDPATYLVKDVVEGEAYNFYNLNMGTQHRTAEGSILVTSANQGRVFEVASDGSVVFDLVNMYDTEHVGYIGDARTVPIDFFEEFPTCE